MLKLVLLGVACGCFVLAALRVKAAVDFMNAGFAFVVASMIV